MSKVTSYKLTPGEIEQMQKGEKTYDELIADKQPLKNDVDLSVLTKESFIALVKQGYSLSEIRKRFNLKIFELDDLKKEWGLADDWRRNKAIINVDKATRPNHKTEPRNDLVPEPKKEEAKVREVKIKLTKELLLKHKGEGMSDAEIQKKYGVTSGVYNYKKKEWGLVKGRGRKAVNSGQPVKSEEVAHVAVAHISAAGNKKACWSDLKGAFKAAEPKIHQALEENKAVITHETNKNKITDFEDKLFEKDDLMYVIEDLKEELLEKNKLIKKLQDLRSEDVKVIDRLKQYLSGTEQALDIARNKVRLSFVENRDNASQDKSLIFDLNEHIDILKKQLQIVKNDHDELKNSYAVTHDNLVSVSKRFEELNQPQNLSGVSDKINRLESLLALSEKNNTELIAQIKSINKYRTMYFNTASTLKLHLPS